MAGSAFGRWYEQNKDKFNERRRKRYHQDKKYREKIVRTVQEKREEQRREREANRPLTYSISEAAGMIGRDSQTIKLWEKKGYIPRTDNGNGYRVYLPHQVQLMSELARLLDKYHYSSPELKSQLRVLMAKFAKEWYANLQEEQGKRRRE